MGLRTVTSVDELIEVLKGPKAAGYVLRATPQMVVNWRAQKSLPARKFLIQRSILRKHGIDAPVSLWGMAEAAE